jgi:hypothetical protein
MPWASIISNYRFDGVDAIQKDGQFAFRTSNNLKTHSKKPGMTVKNHGQVLHEILQNLESLAALNLIASPVGHYNKVKRGSNERWEVHASQQGYDDVFKFMVTSHSFQNEIHHVKCGVDNYTGDTSSNNRACREYLSGIVDHVKDRLGSSYRDASYSSDAMADYLRRRFSSYTMWTNVETLRTKELKIHNKVFQSLKNSLVSKGYADGNCFVRCSTAGWFRQDSYGPHVDFSDNNACQTVCYDPIYDNFERLYGFSNGKASNYPWMLSERDMSKWRVFQAYGSLVLTSPPDTSSYKAYQSSNVRGFYPGAINLDSVSNP